MTRAPAAGASAPLSDRNQFEALFAVQEQHEKMIMMTMVITVTLLRNRGLEKGICYICTEATEYSHAAQRRRELAVSRAASKTVCPQTANRTVTA